MKIQLLLLYFFLININIYAKNLEKVSLQLQWKHQFEFAGFYMAKEKGFYKDVGLDVKLKEYSFGTDIISDVVKGTSTFGTHYPSVILEKFIGNDIILLNAILQQSPHILVSLKSSGIESINDFKDKKIMIDNNAVLTAPIRSMLKSNNITFSDMHNIEHTFSIEDLISGGTDISTAFSSNELYELDTRAIEYKIWDPKDYGFDFYDVILFTSGEELRDNPQKVEFFREASLKGWKYAFENIEESVDLILKKYNTQKRTREALLYEAEILKKLAYVDDIKLGSIDINEIQRIYDMYNLMGLIKNKIEFENFIYKPIKKANTRLSNKLTNSEEEYLTNKKQITMCIDPDWMPFEKIDQKGNHIGNHIGISKDYFKIFEKELGIPINLINTENWRQTLEYAKSRKCDILSLAMETKTRKQYMNFTTPYLSVPLVLATKNHVTFIDNFKQLNNKKIGIVEGYALTEILKKRYPNLNIIETKNNLEGLKKVSNNELFGFIGSIADIGYIFQTSYLADLKITGKFQERWELGIAVRSDDLDLLNIFQKLIDTISEDTKQQIFNKYIAIKYEKGTDYTLLWQISIGFIVILLILVFFYIKQSILRKEIDNLNQNLELKIIEEVKKNRQKDNMLYRQSKLASMGEMLGNIAHQWRQPLNRINLSLAVIDEVIDDKNIDKLILKEKIETSQKNLQYMSDTIEDFSNFFRPNKEMNLFNLSELINKVIKLLETRIQNITVSIPQNQNLMINTYKNELIQVLLIILNNALDNFEISKIKDKKIDIIIKSSNKSIVVLLNDNSGGISSGIIDKIFDPYFSTKFKGEGTGLGLYMAKLVIEDSMGGKLSVVSKNCETTFNITLNACE